MSEKDKLESIKNAIGSYPDFPKKGIIFRDILPILRQPQLFDNLISLLCDHIQTQLGDVSGVVGLDARGFLIAPVIALRLKVPFIPIRKAGKLPGEIKNVSYSLEYGKDSLELQSDSVTKGQKVVIVDDLLATGGTMKAAIQLLQQSGAVVVECIAIIELIELNARSILSAPFFSLIKF